MSVRVPMIFCLGAWLDSKKTELNLPTLLTDTTEESGKSICISQSASIVTEKEYINGSRQCRMDLDFIAQGNHTERKDLIEALTTLCYLFENIRDTDIDENHRILRASSTAPTLKEQTDDGNVRYIIGVSLIYKEI